MSTTSTLTSTSGLAAVQTASAGSADAHDFGHLVTKHRRFFQTGATLPLAYRRQQLRQLRRMLAEHLDEFTAALQQDLGRHAQMAIFGDVRAHRIDECGLGQSHQKLLI